MALNLGPLNVLLRLQGAEKFKRDTKDVTGGLDKLGKKIAGLLTIRAVGQQFMQATQVFAEFERGMVRVGAVTNSLGSTAFAGLTERAQDLAKTTEFTARQVADAMGFMGMAGMKTNQIFDATPAVLQLASAGMVDVASAADTVTNIMSGYGIEAKDLNKANNVLVATFTNSNTSLQQLGQSFKYAGPIAKSAGVEFKEAAAVIGLMGNAGIQADMAGTSLRGSLIKLLDPSKEGAKIMRQYGINVKDSSGKLKPMIEIFKQLQPISGDSAKMIKIFGLEAGPGMQAALSQGTEALEKLIEKIDGAGNIAERVADAQMNTLDGKIKIMKSNAEALQIALGDALEPTSKAFVNALSQAAQFAEYIINVLSFAKEDAADTSEVEAAISKMAAQRKKATAQYQGLQKAIEGGFADVYIEQKLTGYKGLSPEAALGGLEMQIDELTDKIAHIGKKGFKIQLPKPAIPSPASSGKNKFLTEDEQKKQRDAARAAHLREIAPTDFDVAGPEIARVISQIGFAKEIPVEEFDAFMESFKPEIVVDHSEAMKKATEGISQSAQHMINQVAQTVSTFARSFTGGTMGATFGPQIASALGGAIGAVVGSPQVGAAVGGVIGEIFGPLFDVIANGVQVFKPLIDVLNRIAVGLFLPMLVGMAPGMESMARVLNQQVVPLFEILGFTLSFLDLALSNFRIFLENMIIAFKNIQAGNFEGAFTDGMQDFVSIQEHVARIEEERAKILEQLNGETNTTTDRFRELNEELTNVPIGIKKFRSMQFEATRGVTRGTPFGQSAFGV